MSDIVQKLILADLQVLILSDENKRLKEEQRNTSDLLERAEDALRERDIQLAAANETISKWQSLYAALEVLNDIKDERRKRELTIRGFDES